MPSAPLPEPGSTRVVVAGICAVIVTVGIGRFAYTPLLPVMREQAGLTIAASGWLATINYVGYLAGALIASSIHTLQRKWLLYRLGLILAVATTLGMGLTTNVWLWLLLRFIAGWAATSGMLLGTGLVLNWLLRHGRRPDLGVHFGGFGIGMVLSGFASAAMAGHVSWDMQWSFLAVLGMIFLVPAWLWLPKPPAIHQMSIAEDVSRPSRRWMTVFEIAYVCGGFGYVITATFIVDIIRHMNAVAIPGNWVWILMGIVAISSCFLWDVISGWIGRVRSLTLAYAMQTASFALTAFAGNAACILLAAILFGVTVIGTVSLTLSVIGQMFPRNPAKAMARLTIGYCVAQITGPAIAAFMVGNSNNYHDPLLLATVIGVAGTLLTFACSRFDQHAV